MSTDDPCPSRCDGHDLLTIIGLIVWITQIVSWKSKQSSKIICSGSRKEPINNNTTYYTCALARTHTFMHARIYIHTHTWVMSKVASILTKSKSFRNKTIKSPLSQYILWYVTSSVSVIIPLIIHHADFFQFVAIF